MYKFVLVGHGYGGSIISPTSISPGPSRCRLEHRVGGWVVIHFPVVVCTSSPSTMRAYERRRPSAMTIDFVDCVNGLQRAIRIGLLG